MIKRSSPSRRERGFTLVEIAIVLMIVGLLIGGILRGQELIQSARVRNIVDQKSAIQTAYIGFLDRYRMLPGDLTAVQSAVVGNGALNGTTAIAGDGSITLASESTLFFQNLTASGFLSCGGCMSVAVAANGLGPASTVNNSPINVYGSPLVVSNAQSNSNGAGLWFDASVQGLDRLILQTGASIPSQTLAEVDRKADDGLPASGQLRFSAGSGSTFANCAPLLLNAAANPGPWANPSEANCQAAWLF